MDEDEIDEENEAEWRQVAASADELLARILPTHDHFEVSATRFTPYTVDVFIVRYDLTNPHMLERAAREMRVALRQWAPSYWRVRIILNPPRGSSEKPAIWLEVDRFSVYRYRGKIEAELFPDVESMFQHYWA